MWRWPPWCGHRWQAAPGPAACGCGWRPLRGRMSPTVAWLSPSAGGRYCPQSARCPGCGCLPCPPGRPAGTNCRSPCSCLKTFSTGFSFNFICCWNELFSCLNKATINKAWGGAYQGLAGWKHLRCEAGTSEPLSWGRGGAQQTEASPQSASFDWIQLPLASTPTLSSSHTRPSYCCYQPLRRQTETRTRVRGCNDSKGLNAATSGKYFSIPSEA